MRGKRFIRGPTALQGLLLVTPGSLMSTMTELSLFTKTGMMTGLVLCFHSR